MGNMTYRKDYKDLTLWMYIGFLLFVVGSFIINILNLKEVKYLYVTAGCVATAFIIYIFYYSIQYKRSKEALDLTDNNLAFYVSTYKNNKILKSLIAGLGFFSLVMIALTSVFYLYKMDFINVYHESQFFAVTVVAILEIWVIIGDVPKVKRVDRIDIVVNKI